MNKKLEQPIPQGKYVPAIRHLDLVYTSGMTPRRSGKLLYSGQILVSDPIESYKDAVRLAALNALTAAKSCLKEDEEISVIVQFTVFLNAEKEFTAHARIADFASEVFIENLGANCIGTRAAIGVASLPGNACVEISLIAAIK